MNTSWKSNNTFIKYKLNEADRSRFILPNKHLDDNQKKEIIDFFKVHNEAGNDIPWQNKKEILEWKYKDFEPYMYVKPENLIKSNSRKLRKEKGLSSLSEGKDYILFKDNEEYTAYIPLNHKASRIIASNMVEPKLWCESSRMIWTDKEILPENEPMKDGLYPGAKWCISMENPDHWKGFGNNYTFVMFCYKDPKLPDRRKKECITFYKTRLSEENSVDASDSPLELKGYQLDEYWEMGEEVWDVRTRESRKERENYLNSLEYVNGKYNKPEDVEADWNLILDENGVSTIPFGVWEGDCTPPMDITSLKNFPEEVTGFLKIDSINLKSLEGGPKKVGKGCQISSMYLRSLKGGPEYVGGTFTLKYGYVENLIGGPKEIGGNCYIIDCDRLDSLEGAPKKVGRNFVVERCYNLPDDVKPDTEISGKLMM